MEFTDQVGGKGEKKKQTVFSAAKELGDGRQGNQGTQPNSVHGKGTVC